MKKAAFIALVVASAFLTTILSSLFPHGRHYTALLASQTVQQDFSSVVTELAYNSLVHAADEQASGGVRGEVYFELKRFSWKNILLSSLTVALPLEYRETELIIRGGTIKASTGSVLQSSKQTDESLTFRDLLITIPVLRYSLAGEISGTVQARAAILRVPRGKGDFSTIKNISLNALLKGDLSDNLLEVTSFTATSDTVKSLSGRASVNLRAPVTITADARYGPFDIAESLKLLALDSLVPPDLQVRGAGTMEISLTIVVPVRGPARVSIMTDIGVRGGGFSSPDETIISEGMDIDFSGTLAFPLPMESADFSFQGEARDFELLADKFYGSFKDRPLEFSAEGKYTFPDDALSLSRARVGLSRTGELISSGTMLHMRTSPSLQLDVSLSRLSHEEAFNFFIRDTFKEQYPFLEGITINGVSSFDVSVDGQADNFTVRGLYRMADTEITGLEGKGSIQDLSMTVPLLLSFPNAGDNGTPARFGSLTFGQLSWNALTFEDITFEPTVWNNSLMFKEDVSLPTLGGLIDVRNFQFDHLFDSQRTLNLAVDIHDIDLAAASSAAGLPQFSGTLSGTIPSVTFREDSLLSEGVVVLQLFNGTMTVSDFSLTNVLSPIMSMRSSIELKDIDLGQLTSTFDFGRITGIMEGSIKNLVIVNGQAERFTASMQTVRTKGIPQKISVEALRKISILGTGASTSILDRGLYQFFKEYRYARMGFRAALRNDNLLLLGIETENNRGYLVKGGLLPPKVNVVSYTQNISFKEMLKRLKRISQAEKVKRGNGS